MVLLIIKYAIIYTLGVLLSNWMLKIEHESDDEEYTRKDQVIQLALSALSWLMVMISLIAAWFNHTGKNGFWDKPLKPKQPVKTETE